MDGFTAGQLDCVRRNLDGMVLSFHAPLKMTPPRRVEDALLHSCSQIFYGHFPGVSMLVCVGTLQSL